MSIDLGAILDQVQPVIEALIESAGTVVTLLDNPQRAVDEQVDPDDLSSIDPTPDAPNDTGIPALVVPAISLAQQQDGPQLTSRTDNYVVLLLPDQEPPAVHTMVRVDECRDTALLGMRLHVLGVSGSSAGAVRRLDCGPIR